MSRPLFRPSLRQAAWLAAIALVSIGYALLSAPPGDRAIRRGHRLRGRDRRRGCAPAATPRYRCSRPVVFGLVAIGAALLNLVRPSFVLCAVALIAGGFGIVLYNVALSAFAVALLILSLARPAPEPD